MAHLGKVYPVHFRRDFNLNVTNNGAGFAKAYNCFFAGASGTIGAELRVKPLVCIAKDETTFAGMKWESNFEPRAGYYVKFVAATIFPPTPNDILIRGELTEQTLGSLGVATFGALNQFVYNSLNMHWDPLSLTHPALFAMGSTQFTQFDRVRWAQWNNL